MVGLSSAGQLLFWKLPDLQLAQRLSVPAPPPISALVRLLYWPAAQALVWPSRGGDLVLSDLDGRRIRCVPAHAGVFYAMTVVNSELVTIGKGDGLAKCWNPGTSQPRTAKTAMRDTIAAATLWDSDLRLLLVDESGDAAVCSLDGTGMLCCAHRLAGRGYRSARGADAGTADAIRQRQVAHEAESLAAQINERMQHRQTEGIDELHQRLGQLGYRHVSLALRAAEARSRKDVLADLQAYHALAAILPGDAPSGAVSLRRYAQLLELVWQLEAARTVYRQLAERSGDVTAGEHAEELAAEVDAIANQPSVIQSKRPVDLLVRCASAVGRAFAGRFSVHEYEPVSCGSVSVMPKQLVEECEQVRQAAALECFAIGSCERVCWLVDGGMKQENLVVLDHQRGF
jgi:hypothetical protein